MTEREDLYISDAMLRRLSTHGRFYEDEQKAFLELIRLRQWVKDLQSAMYINCVYCGHRYGPKESTPVAMADVLKQHIAECPEHPLSKANAAITQLRETITRAYDKLAVEEVDPNEWRQTVLAILRREALPD